MPHGDALRLSQLMLEFYESVSPRFFQLLLLSSLHEFLNSKYSVQSSYYFRQFCLHKEAVNLHLA